MVTSLDGAESMSGFQFPNINPVDSDRLRKLRSTIGSGPVLILTHDNPDPDAFASGKVFATLFQVAWGISSRLVYSGMVARAENKAMLRLLTPEWEQEDVLSDIKHYSAIVLVDTQPGAGNNSLMDGVDPQVVIDHHYPIQKGLDRIAFTDVRTEMGATVSLAFQYLEAAGIIPDEGLATAIFYGIHADTMGLSRGGSTTDQEIYIQLLKLINRDLLAQIAQARLPREYFSTFTRGLRAARIYGQVVICCLGEMHHPDFVAEIADLLIRLENIRAALCLGYHHRTIYLSLRTMQPEMDAGSLIQKVVVPPGKAGGHGTIAGGRMPLNAGSVDRIVAEIERRFLKVMGETTHKGEDLLL
jgi:nanoRNase/pAp phosphatase (c-di-AMP/oligoRNAs hydrolase)